MNPHMNPQTRELRFPTPAGTIELQVDYWVKDGNISVEHRVPVVWDNIFTAMDRFIYECAVLYGLGFEMYEVSGDATILWNKDVGERGPLSFIDEMLNTVHYTTR